MENSAPALQRPSNEIERDWRSFCDGRHSTSTLDRQPVHSTLSESDPERKLSIVVRVVQGASQKHSARGGLSMRPARRFEIIGDKRRDR